MINDLTGFPDRLTRARDRNVVAGRASPSSSNANGVAVIVLTGDHAVAARNGMHAADGGGLDANGRRTSSIGQDVTPKRLSVHLEFADATSSQSVLDTHGEEVPTPRPALLPSLPSPPMEVATLSGTPEAHRAVAAYSSQLEQYNRLRYENTPQAQSVRMRA